MSFIDDIGDGISSAASAVGGAIEDAADTVVHGAEDAVGAISSGFSSVESFASDAFSVMKTGVSDVVDCVEDVAKSVEHAAEDAIDETGSFLKKAVNYVGGELEAAAKGVWDGVKDVADGVYGACKDVFEGVTQGVGGFCKNIVEGHVGDAFQSLINGADKAFIQGPQRFWNGCVDGVQDALDGASHLLGPAGDAARQVIDRGADIVRTAGNTVFEAARDVYRVFTEVPLNFATDMYKVGDDIFHGRFGDAAKDFGGAFLHVGTRVGGFIGDVTMRTLQGVASIFQTATFLEPPSRKLNDNEKKLLREVYGDSIDVDAIRIKDGGALNNAMAPHTVGNTIYLPHNKTGEVYNKDGTVTEYGKLLIHESGHVWQSENAGGDYISKSLYEQSKASLEGGTRDDAYDFKNDVDNGKPFSDLNPEQQAKYIETVLGPIIGMSGDAYDNLKAAHDNHQLTDAEYAYAKQALDDILAGKGAA